jgi:hypothetical protein
MGVPTHCIVLPERLCTAMRVLVKCCGTPRCTRYHSGASFFGEVWSTNSLSYLTIRIYWVPGHGIIGIASDQTCRAQTGISPLRVPCVPIIWPGTRTACSYSSSSDGRFSGILCRCMHGAKVGAVVAVVVQWDPNGTKLQNCISSNRRIRLSISCRKDRDAETHAS